MTNTDTPAAPETQPAPKFKRGDVVHLNSVNGLNGPLMTVIEPKTIDGDVRCVWYENGEFRQYVFPEDCLTLISRQEPPTPPEGFTCVQGKDMMPGVAPPAGLHTWHNSDQSWHAIEFTTDEETCIRRTGMNYLPEAWFALPKTS